METCGQNPCEVGRPRKNIFVHAVDGPIDMYGQMSGLCQPDTLTPVNGYNRSLQKRHLSAFVNLRARGSWR